MRNAVKKWGLAVAAVAAVTTAQAQFTLSGDIRPRTEYRHGYKTLIDSLQKGSVFTSQRTRINFGYTSDKLKTGVSFQDIRIWGSQPQLNSTDGLTSLHEGWGEFFLYKTLSIKLGRQEVSYDDDRFMGNVEWAQQARSHDLVLLKYSDSAFTVHSGIAYNQNNESNTGTPYTVSGYKEMHFLWAHKKFNAMTVSILLHNNGIQSPVSIHSTRFSQTAGTHLEYKKNKLHAGFNYYHQLGHDNSTGSNGKIRTINALMAGAEVFYKISTSLSAGAGYELQSGQSQTDTTASYKNVNHAFNPLYGTNHKFNGFMDYFYVGNHLNSVGLQDIYVKLKYKKEKWWAGVDVHLFSAAADVLDKEKLLSGSVYKAMDPDFGTEIDFTLSYTLSPNVNLLAGYSYLLATETLEVIKGGKYDLTQNWAFLQLSFKPTFLK